MRNISKILASILIAAMLIPLAACNTSNASTSSIDESGKTSSSTASDLSNITSELSSSSATSTNSVASSISVVSIKSSSKINSQSTSSTAFNKDEFATLSNNNLSVVYYISLSDYNDMVKKGRTDPFYATATDFEKKYGGKVKFTIVPFTSLVEKTVLMQQSSGSAPDLLLLNDQTFPSTAVAKVIQPLEDLKDSSGKKVDFRKQLWNETTMSAFQYAGKTYGISGKNSLPLVTLLYYNETMFKQAGLTLPKDLYKQGKWTWDEFAKAGAALTKDTNGDGKYEQFGFSTYTTIPSIFTLSNDTSVMKIDNKGKYIANLNDSKVLSTLNFLYNALQTPDKGGYIDYTESQSFESDFPAGKLAMEAAAVPSSTIKFDWDAVPMPVGPNNTNKKLVGSMMAYGIPNGSKNPEGALAFLYMMNDPKYTNTNLASSIATLSGNTGGKPDAAKGQWNYNNYVNNSNIQISYSMDRDFPDVWQVYWNICKDLNAGSTAASVATKYQQILQADLNKAYGS